MFHSFNECLLGIYYMPLETSWGAQWWIAVDVADKAPALWVFILMGEGGNRQTYNLIYDVQQEVTSAMVETRQVKWQLVTGGYLDRTTDTL